MNLPALRDKVRDAEAALAISQSFVDKWPTFPASKWRHKQAKIKLARAQSELREAEMLGVNYGD